MEARGGSSPESSDLLANTLIGPDGRPGWEGRPVAQASFLPGAVFPKNVPGHGGQTMHSANVSPRELF
jgi:hypothetical protein